MEKKDDAALAEVPEETINTASQPMVPGLTMTPMSICNNIQFYYPPSHSAIMPDKGSARFRNSRSVHKAAFCPSLQFRYFPLCFFS